jgi:putative secretion ATPase (PEP-CTERM system associated)
MYERFYNLRERPFALSPDPEYLYLSRVHSEALDSIRYGVESRAGFIVVTGEIGAGKTTLLQTVLRRLDDRAVIARLVNTMLDPRELLEAIALDFGLEDISKSKAVLVRDLGLFLVEQRRQGRRPLLVIDEAQNLSPLALEEVRLLSNLETEKSKLLQIVLAGQPNLRDTIATPELEQFRQRIAVSYHLMPLEPADTAAYINFRLEHAALGEPLRFPPDACSLVHEISGGVPRIINVVCDAALVFGYAEERHTVDRATIDEVITELEATGIVRRAAPTPTVQVPQIAAATAAPGVTLPNPAAASTPVPVTAPTPQPATTAARPAAGSSTPAVTPATTAASSNQTGHVPKPVRSTPTMPVTTPDAPAPYESLISPLTPEAIADDFWRAAAPAPASNPATSTTPTAAVQGMGLPGPGSAITDTQRNRDLSLAAARDAALQANQLASAREAVAAEREDLARRQRDLAAREQALVERERQIAEQRRIMGEEYRLLRQTQSARSAATPGSRSSVTINRASNPAASSSSDRELTFWQRLSRRLTWSPAVRS